MNTKGVSLIALIITIAIIVIVATVTIQKGFQRTDDARIASHNHTITSIQEEIQNYYYFKGGELPIKKDTSNNLLTYAVPAGSALETEINRNGDGGDKLYIIDMTKLGSSSTNIGAGVGNDIFVVTENRHNVYYIKGDTVKGLTYHGVIGKSVVAISNSNFDGKVNKPKLAAGMTPITWNGSQWVIVDSSNKNNEWYDYNKTANKWANCRLNDGSMLVWIPRYTYKILNNEHNGGIGISGDIDVKFSNGTTDDTTGGYRIHPAFYWGGWTIPANADMIKQPGGTEITGIWVGKFEVSAANGLQSTSGDRIKVVPNVSSWRFMIINDMFDKCRQIQTTNPNIYGITTDTSMIDLHLLKNSEWGAVAYLCKYAKGTVEVSINDDVNYIGGKGDYIANISLSTTGNEYGVYDMSGAAWEHVSCYINNSNSSLSTYGASVLNSPERYKDVFPVSGSDFTGPNYNLTDKTYGHAFWEISNSAVGWFGDKSYYFEGTGAFMMRGGGNSGTDAGVFAFNCKHGNVSAYTSWRLSIIVL